MVDLKFRDFSVCFYGVVKVVLRIMNKCTSRHHFSHRELSLYILFSIPRTLLSFYLFQYTF